MPTKSEQAFGLPADSCVNPALERRKPSRFAYLCALLLALLLAAPGYAAVGVAIATNNPTPVAGGAAFSVTVTVTNQDAGAAASNVLMTYPLPLSVRFQSLSIAGTSAGAFTCLGPPVATNGTVNCSAVSVPASGTMVLTVVADIDPNTAPGVRTNTARVVSGGTQNSASVQQNISNSAALALSLAATPSVATGGNVVYRIAVTHTSSNSSARGVIVTDKLPTGTSFVALQGAGAFYGNCDFNPTNDMATCVAPELPVGTHEINLIVKVSAAPGTLSNSASLTATNGSVSGSPASALTTITN